MVESPRGPWSLGLLVTGILVVVASLVGMFSFPPPEPKDRPELLFSASRAMDTLKAVARVAHPVYSQDQAEVRRILRETLEGVGLPVEVQEDEVLAPRKNMGGRVSNLLVKVPGAAPPGTLGPILFLTHYDSVPFGPGASDNGSGCAVLSETARALGQAVRQGWKPRRDIQLLWTDGEEYGQLGAEAYLARNSLRPSLVINLDTLRDTPLFLIRESQGNEGVLEALGGTPGILGFSWIAALAGGVNFDSDYSPFRSAGIPGASLVSLAFFPQYHTAQDTVDQVNPGAIQQGGDAVLHLAKALGDSGAPRFDAAPAVYFSIPGWGWVHLPTWLVPAVLMAVVFLVVLAFSLRFLKGGLNLGRWLVGAGLVALVVLGAALLGMGLDLLIRGLRPGYQIARYSSHYPLDWLWALAFGSLGVTWLAVSLRWFRRWMTPADDLVEATVILLTAVAAALSWAVPEAAYLAQVPAASGALAILLKTYWPRVATLGEGIFFGLVSGLVWGPVGPVLYFGLGMGGLAFLVPWAILVTIGWVPLARSILPRSKPVVVASGALSLVLSTAALLLVGFSDSCPQPTNLGYVYNADTKAAAWFVLGGARTDWQKDAVGKTPSGTPFPLSQVSPFAPIYPAEAFPARPVAIPGPLAQWQEGRTEGSLRWLTVRMTLPGEGGLQIGIPASVPLRNVEVGGHRYEAKDLLSGGLFQWTHYTMARSLTVGLAVSTLDSSSSEVPLILASLTDRLPDQVPVPPLPRGTRPQNDSTTVVRTYRVGTE